MASTPERGHPPPRAGRLPLSARVLYAAGSAGSEALIQSRALWLVFFYLEAHDEKLVNPFVLGVLVPVAALVNAFWDPTVGYLSDRTHSRLGRRLPFILAATPFWALFGFLLFTPPDTSRTLVAVYFFAVFELYALTSTLSGGPYESLLPEISHESDERMSIVGTRVWFGALGGLAGLVLSGIIKDAAGFAAMALAMACLAVTFRYLGVIGIWNHASRTTPPVELPFAGAVLQTFRNRSFLSFLPSFVLFQLSYQLVLAMLPFFVKVVLDVPSGEEGRWVAILTAIAIAVVVLSVPRHRRFARRTSKRRAYRRAMLMGATLFPLAAVVGLIPGVSDTAQLALLMALVGFPIAGVYLFPGPLTADIVDDDSLRTGMRREAMYFGAQNFVEKVVTALSAPILIGVLALGDSSDNTLGIRLVGPVAGLILLTGYLLFRRYDLPDDPMAAAERAAGPTPIALAGTAGGTVPGREVGGPPFLVQREE
jgi:GPH family glycoside/pentoside/hexuronide:cation symporter